MEWGRRPPPSGEGPASWSVPLFPDQGSARLRPDHPPTRSSGPGTGGQGRQVWLSRGTIDRWTRDYRRGGFPALVPEPRKAVPRTPLEVLELAAALKRENPARTAAQILRTTQGWSPTGRTLQRHFVNAGLTGTGGDDKSVFGRFEAVRGNELCNLRTDPEHLSDLRVRWPRASRRRTAASCPVRCGVHDIAPVSWRPRATAADSEGFLLPNDQPALRLPSGGSFIVAAKHPSAGQR